jgi:hypothetical protein
MARAWTETRMGAFGGEGLLCGLTFEVRRDRRYCAWPARRMMNQGGSRAKCDAVGPRLDRGVRRHLRGGTRATPSPMELGKDVLQRSRSYT